MVRKGILTALAALLIAAPAWADPDDLAEAQADALSGFGGRIKQAQATTDHLDDYALALEILAVAQDTPGTVNQRFALADLAVYAAAGGGHEQNIALAYKALTIAAAIRPYPAGLSELRVMQITVFHQQYLERTKAPKDRLRRAARTAALAQTSFLFASVRVRAYFKEATETLPAARRTISTYGYKDLIPRTDLAEKLLAGAQVAQREFAEAEADLAAASKRQDADAAAEAKKELAELTLKYDGDVTGAAAHLEGLDHPFADAVTTAAIFKLGKQKLPVKDVLSSMTWLVDRAQGSEDLARQALAELALAMADYVAEETSQERDRALVKVFRARLGQLVADVTGAKPVENEQDEREQLNASLAKLPGGAFRYTYDFAKSVQMKDWRPLRDKWELAGDGSLHCNQSSSYGESTIVWRLRLRADRPVRLSLKARGVSQIGAALDFRRWGSQTSQVGYGLSLASDEHPGRHKEGMVITVANQKRHDATNRLISNRDYHLEFESDGSGACSWSVNGKVIFAHRPIRTDAKGTAGSLELRLVTSKVAGRTPTTFDDIVIEGQPLPSSDWRPKE